MTNVFIVAANDRAARANLERTVRAPVLLEDLEGLSRAARVAARKQRRGVFAWGTMPGRKDRNLSAWRAMERGDWVLFYSKGDFPFAGRVLLREQSRRVAERLWGADDKGQTWEHLYLMDEMRRLDAPRRAVNDAFVYKPGSFPRGFARVDRDLDARPGGVERLLIDLGATGDALDRAVDALRDGDEASAVVEVDRLAQVLPDAAALEEAIRSRVSSAPPAERVALQKRLKRDRGLAIRVKALYEGRCQCCGFTFAKPDGTPYSEAAHLRRISLREADLDIGDNIVVLCPNHHKMLDYGAMEIEYDAAAGELLWHCDGTTEVLENKHIGPDRSKRGKGKK